MNIIERLITEKIAENAFAAAAIANGLKFADLKDDEERIERARLYRRWRTKTDKKNDIPSWQAFALAIAGIDPDDVAERQIEMELTA
jgi:hypothetical protein